MTPSQATKYENFLQWCYQYLPHHFYGEPAPFHTEIAEDVKHHSRCAYAAPRGHNKSTLLSLGYPLYCAALGIRRFILIVSDTQTQATDHVSNVRRELEDNPRLARDYPHLRLPGSKDYGKKAQLKTTKDFRTVSGIRFSAKGAGTALRGLRDKNQRPDLIVVDDLENDEAVNSPEQRQKLEDWFFKSLSNLFGAKGGQLIVIGTILHESSLLKTLLGNENYHTKLWRAIDEEGTPLWASAWTKEKLQAKLVEIGSRNFATEFLNDPSQADQAIFKREWLQVGLAPSAFDSMVVALDPSTTASGDACGIVAVGRKEGQYFVLADATLQGSPNAWGKAALQLAAQLHADVVYEKNQGGQMVESVLELAAKNMNIKLPRLYPVHASAGKVSRAQPVAVEYENRRVIHCGQFTELENELCSWIQGLPSPNRMDALVWAISHLMQPPQPLPFFFK